MYLEKSSLTEHGSEKLVSTLVYLYHISDYEIFLAKRGDELSGLVNKDIQSFNIYNCGRPRS